MRVHSHEHEQYTRSDHIKELVQASRTGLTPRSLLELEELLNTTWTKYNIAFVLTGTHLLERLEREEHSQHPICLYELTRIFNEFTRRYSWYCALLPPEQEHYGVMCESFSHINVGFVLRPGRGISGFDRDLMLQTILRKPNFFTNNRIYRV